jgi:hypothetical protein
MQNKSSYAIPQCICTIFAIYYSAAHHGNIALRIHYVHHGHPRIFNLCKFVHFVFFCFKQPIGLCARSS